MAYSAGPRMVLLLQHSRELILSAHKSISTTLSVSEIAMHFDSFIILVDYATGFLMRSLAALTLTGDPGTTTDITPPTVQNAPPGRRKID